MKKLCAYLITAVFSLTINAQYYLRGEIKDEKNEPVQNVRILLHSDKMLYYSGVSGGFGITTRALNDSLTLSADGFQGVTVGIRADVFQNITLKSLLPDASKTRKKLISITRDQTQSYKFTWALDGESYFSLIENEEATASRFPNTAFSLNINKASYSNIRRFLNTQSAVPPDAVRVEELLNYFNLGYKEPPDDRVFNIESQYGECPWNPQNNLLYLNVSAKKLNLENVPPSNLVFLIDASGSMDMPNRLPLVKAAFQMLVKNLRPIDTVSIVIYGGNVAVWMSPTSGSEKQKIIRSIEQLTATGDTPGESAIRVAYNVARSSFIKNGTNRVILATDGDFNVGETSEKALEELITRERESGVYLTCLGVGMGNFKDSKLETLAKRGNGNYAYLDDIREAEKVLVKEVTQTFYSVADDVSLNVHFNPEKVNRYRLIGFDNKRDAISDSTGVLEGGEIGSGNSVMAIFEVVPQVQASTTSTSTNTSLATITLDYTPSGEPEPKKLVYDCRDNYLSFKDLNPEYRFGASVAMFGMKLRESPYLPNSEWEDIEAIAAAAQNPDEYLQKEFVQLVATAKKVYGKGKKGRRSR